MNFETSSPASLGSVETATNSSLNTFGCSPLAEILPVLAKIPTVAQVLASGRVEAKIPNKTGLQIQAVSGVRPALVALLAAERPVVVVTPSGREAENFTNDLSMYLPAETVACLPAWETLPHERLSPRPDTVAKRLAVFQRLANPDVSSEGLASQRGPIQVLTMPIRCILQPVVANLGQIKPLKVQVGDTVDREELVAQLVANAYERTDMVSARGQFALRGSIVDVFAPTDSHPLRIEFFGDEVEEIRFFSVADQRTFAPAPAGIWALACRELLLTESVRARAEKLADCLPGARDILELAAQGIASEGIESLTAVLADGLTSVASLLPPNALVLVVDPQRVEKRCTDLHATAAEFMQAAWAAAAAGAKNAPIDLRAAAFQDLETVEEEIKTAGGGWWQLSDFAADVELAKIMPAGQLQAINLPVQTVPRYSGDIAAAAADLRLWASQGKHLILVAEGPGQAKRFLEALSGAEVPCRLVNSSTASVTSLGLVKEEKQAAEQVLVSMQAAGVVQILVGTATAAMQVPEANLVLLPAAVITGRAGTSTRDMRILPARRRKNVVDPLALTKGALVVHEQHGIGRFLELTTRMVGKGESATKREYIVLEYAPSKRGQPGDQLWVPTDQLDLISRYSGGEEPALSKMGGADWQRAKQKARRAVKEIAGELVRLYAARAASKGHAFSQDTPWQRELEEAFPYQETPDQLVTIEEVKADMEREMPMDRLVSGDVGYGKTEIAVRAAFKAVMDQKQVAVLVPTTLLVAQHTQTFAERYAGFPLKVASLSRFQSEKESREVINGLADGTVDVVIGTHRLLTGEVRFKDLGLVIIDEEQRFGVEHKETIKQLRANVDVLAMSATPIPRTLEMAITGIREMSTLATPPEDRHPILTFVGAYQESQVVAAIRRELLRDGQVFYVHNKVSDISKVAASLQQIVPEARVAVAHGRMSEHQLEMVIQDFWDRQIDVLVCTTIVETGLDISNANTLIVDRADNMGLSQLHQLRGRVGRGRERAYAYFLYPRDKSLTETAHERLRTIATHTDLGAGIQVAMKDLEIRGAGNLLGGEQSGHIAGVGFDLYVRMVAEAVRDYQNGRTPFAACGSVNPSELESADLGELRIDLPVEALVPETYVSSERLRLEIYGKISAIDSPGMETLVRDELLDRYGSYPASVERLFILSRLRRLAKQIGLREIVRQGSYLRLGPLELSDSAALRLKRLYPRAVQKLAVRQILLPLPTKSPTGGIALSKAEVVQDEKLLDFVIDALQQLTGVGDSPNVGENKPITGVRLG